MKVVTIYRLCRDISIIAPLGIYTVPRLGQTEIMIYLSTHQIDHLLFFTCRYEGLCRVCMYSADTTQETCAKSCRSYGSHPATWTTSCKIGPRSAVKHLDHDLSVDDLPEACSCSRRREGRLCNSSEGACFLITRVIRYTPHVAKRLLSPSKRAFLMWWCYGRQILNESAISAICGVGMAEEAAI